MRALSKVLSFSFSKRSLQVQGVHRKSFSSHFTTREFEEIQLSVPWGHIAGKWYGSKDTRPIVGFHGWQDNAGTYDTLAPLLPPHIGFLSIDLPGHGLSSWLPDGCSYNSMDHINIFLLLMRKYKWNKISMINHSMSATDALIFAALFPDKCDLLVSLDIAQPFLGKKETTINNMIENVKSYNKQYEIFYRKTKPPSYNIDELIERMRKANRNSISNECYEFILKRNISPSKEQSDKYYLNRDGRLRSMTLSVIPIDITIEMARRIKCPHLFMRFQKAYHSHTELELKHVMDAFKTHQNFEYHLIDGTHYVHLNEPHKIAEIVNPFIIKYRP